MVSAARGREAGAPVSQQQSRGPRAPGGGTGRPPGTDRRAPQEDRHGAGATPAEHPGPDRMWRAGRHSSGGGPTLHIARMVSGWPGAVVLLVGVAVVGSLALAGILDPVVVDRGPALWVVVGMAGVGVAVSLATRPARWWCSTALVLAAVVAVVVTAVWAWIRASGLTGGTPYPASFLVLSALALFALGAAVTGLRHGGFALRTTRVLAGPAAVLAVFLVIDSFYGYWPTVGTLLGHPLPGQVSKRKLAADIHNGRGLPPSGEFGPVLIPGRSVGFRPSDSYVWLPPDFNRVDHANLPVIVTLTGIPGRAVDWARAGGAVGASAAWARRHGGQAPVVVMVDENGLPNHDTECLDSRQGPAFRYLTQAVPAWIVRVLGIREEPQRWGLAGFSEGGTCTLVLALKDHGLFGRFMDISGDAAPDFGTNGRLTLPVLFDGSVARQRAWNPRLLMARHRYPHLEGWFAAGLQDKGHHLIEPILARDAALAGIDVHTWWARGHHTWTFARQAFKHLYPAFAGSLEAGSRSPRRYGPVQARTVAHVSGSVPAPAPAPGDVSTPAQGSRLPRPGTIGAVTIPGAAVGFDAASAYLWLPPDYRSVPRASVPVIVTLTGIPGRALNWAHVGGVLATSDSWARSHHGRAPAVLMLQENGAAQHDTECLNSREGQAFSYLTRVVPAWITARLGIPHDPRRWGLVGFSEGGTCSLLLALTAHALWGRFMDISGDAAPDYGTSAAEGLRVLYGGNVAAERAHTPRLLMRTHRYPQLEAWFAAGLEDKGHHLIEPILARDAVWAGIRVHTWWVPGRHTWVFARRAFEHFYPSFVRALYGPSSAPSRPPG